MAAVGTYTLLHTIAMPSAPYSGIFGSKAGTMFVLSVVGGSYVANGLPTNLSTDISFAAFGLGPFRVSDTKTAWYIPAGTSYAGSAAKFKVISNGTEMGANATVPSFTAILMGQGPMAGSLS